MNKELFFVVKSNLEKDNRTVAQITNCIEPIRSRLIQECDFINNAIIYCDEDYIFQTAEMFFLKLLSVSQIEDPKNSSCFIRAVILPDELKKFFYPDNEKTP